MRPYRKRPEVLVVQLTLQEKQELRRAAEQACVPVTVLARAVLLAAVRRGGEIVIDASAKAA
jgi:hypothetical protein